MEDPDLDRRCSRCGALLDSEPEDMTICYDCQLWYGKVLLALVLLVLMVWWVVSGGLSSRLSG